MWTYNPLNRLALFNVLFKITKNICQQQINPQSSIIIEKHIHKARNRIFHMESYNIVLTFF